MKQIRELLSRLLPARQDDPGHQLFFLHIPKTAGSSFTQILKSLYSKDDIFHQMDTPALIRLLDSGDYHHRIYIGHYYYDVLARFPVRPRVLTFLRDPRHRVISHYYYYRKQSAEAVAKMPAWDKVIFELTREYDFPSFISLDRAEVEQAFSNVQTRHLANNTDLRVPREPAERQALLDLAQEHLNRIEFVGIVERFEESLALFGRRFSVERELKPVMVNSNQSRPEDPDEVAVFSRNDVARSRVELDEKLYRTGLELFERSLKQTSA